MSKYGALKDLYANVEIGVSLRANMVFLRTHVVSILALLTWLSVELEQAMFLHIALHGRPPQWNGHVMLLALMSKPLALLTWLARASMTFHIWPATTRNGHVMLLALMSKPSNLAYLASLIKHGRPPQGVYEQKFCS
ncbi:hypothetical protein TIFTF001_031519 [Ficus carica]|uniref:Uncharacterized protein n=1 Tax=Ficus carica TaxID=3494 RepID=A0AA88J4A3_FICCA|nr:hypothetical protein TIFTF001_031519 [Ficus carica]